MRTPVQQKLKASRDVGAARDMNATHFIGPLFLLLYSVLVNSHVFCLVVLGRGLCDLGFGFLRRRGLVVANLQGRRQKGRN